MAEMGPFYAYKETRLNLDPATEGSTISIRLPSPSGSTWSSKHTKRSSVADISVAEDENQFKQRHLASAASIYHRQYHKSPRSFLWRVLEDGRVLSIRAVDISKQTNAADSDLTLRLSFQDGIKPGCIAFSDSSEHDVLSAFVLTESHHLYTLSLRPDYFRKASSTEDNVGDWCKIYVSSAFPFKRPHRMVALSADELLASAIDGSLLRLTKQSGGDGKVHNILRLHRC
jgi:nuclear pore complex protein Nup160